MGRMSVSSMDAHSKLKWYKHTSAGNAIAFVTFKDTAWRSYPKNGENMQNNITRIISHQNNDTLNYSVHTSHNNQIFS